VERESCLEERLKVKNTSIAKHVSELNTYSKKLENFCSSLSEVSDELVDQDVELNSLYKELKTLHETKDRLQEENDQLSALVERYKVAETVTELCHKIVDTEEHERLKEYATSTADQLEESQTAIRTLNDELERTQQTLLAREQSYVQQIDSLREKIVALEQEVESRQQTLLSREQSYAQQIESLREKIGALEQETNEYAKSAQCERSKREALIVELKQQLRDRDTRSNADEESECDRLRRRIDEQTDENRNLRELLEKNVALEERVKAAAVAAIPCHVADADIDVVFAAIAAVLGAVDEFVDSSEPSWRLMITTLPAWCERVVLLKTAAERCATLETRIAELESRLTEEAAERSDVVVELEAKLNTLSSERDQVIASLKVS
jgi:chromosome segregation ATPase